MLDQDVARYQHLTLVHSYQWDWLRFFDGNPLPNNFPILAVQVIDEDRFRPLSDCPHLSPGIPVFSPRAIDSLKQLLDSSGELVKLDCSDGEYYAYNVTCVLDALDEAQSELKRFPCDQQVMLVKRYAFDYSRLGDAIIFKIPQEARGRVFCTERFVSAVRKATLLGFELRPVAG